MTRLLLPGAAAGIASVSGARFHYLTRVLRLREGDALEVFDGAGAAFDARLTALAEDSATLELGARRDVQQARPVTVIQGLPKADKLELVLQKGTELGAAAFAPVATSQCIVKVQERAEKKLERWTRIVEEAARQCGRSDVPRVHLRASLDEAVAALEPGTALLVLDVAEREMPLSQALKSTPTPRTPVALVVGPEGGLTKDEVQRLVSLGGIAVTLGTNVLRTETAALAALSVLRHLDGQLG